MYDVIDFMRRYIDVIFSLHICLLKGILRANNTIDRHFYKMLRYVCYIKGFVINLVTSQCDVIIEKLNILDLFVAYKHV